MEQKETRGRPEKDKSYKAVRQRAEASKRIKEYRLRLGLTQEQMAEDVLYIRPRTLQRIESEKVDIGVSKDYADILERHSGIIAEYWMGETILTNRADYDEQALSDRYDREDLERVTASITYKFKSYVKQCAAMFDLFGYQYECLADPTSIHDMVIVLDRKNGYDGSGEVYHRLTPYKEPSKQFHFTQTRFDEIVTRLQETVAFECFRKNDNDTYDGFDGRRCAALGVIDASEIMNPGGEYTL